VAATVGAAAETVAVAVVAGATRAAVVATR